MASSPTFASLGLPPWLADSCYQMGFKAPTPIQVQCIPRVLKGQNVIGQAQTGSGKTAAFALPMLTKLSQDPYGIFGLVLTPTRELAFQIDEQFRALGARLSLNTCVVVGGLNPLRQVTQLADRPHVVIATPGRLSWHIRQGATLNFEELAFLVLDEADRLFEECFQDDLTTISELLPTSPPPQILLFSATITKAVNNFKTLKMNNPVFLQAQTQHETEVAGLDQKYLAMPQNVKSCYLVYLLSLPQWTEKSAIIFVATCRGCQILHDLLLELDIDCVMLHSKMDQPRRMAALGKFRAGKSRLLIATDVASRGLDIPRVALVVNFDVPRMAEDYIHRIGRTARAGRGGQAITFVSQYDVALFQCIEEGIHKKLEALSPFNEDKALELLSKVTNAGRLATIRAEEFELKSRKIAKVDENKPNREKREKRFPRKEGTRKEGEEVSRTKKKKDS